MGYSVPTTVFWVAGFLLLLSALTHYTRNSVLPPVCWILLGGALYGAVRHYSGVDLPAFHAGPKVILYVFLPLLIFDSSRRLHARELWSVLPASSLLAFLGPVAGMFLLGLPMVALGAAPFPDALLFGAVISATDPVSVSAVFRVFPVPERLKTTLEGESLLNDGVTMLLFSVLAGIVVKGSVISFPVTVARFFGAVAGALLAGAAVGALATLLMRRWHELHTRFIGGLMPLIAVYVAFALAEHVLHVSGVLAVMAATLVFGSLHIHRTRQSGASETDEFLDDFWGFLGQLANGVLFFILGERMGEHAYRLPWYFIPAMIPVLLASRAVLVYGVSGVLNAAKRDIPLAWQHVLNIGGMRGALAVALLLLPEDYAYRNTFLCIAFAMVAFTIICNTLFMRGYLDRSSASALQAGGQEDDR